MKESGVFIPINPGNAGLSVGAALHLSRNGRRPVSAFLGPTYDPEAIKATLDNCKLKYTWESAVHEYFRRAACIAVHGLRCAVRHTRFAHILPGPEAHVRIHTAGTEALRIPIVANTSSNGFRESIVCSPRDAIRVFYGSGIDTLIMDKFVLRK